ncbi:hypothetical protein C2R22_07250 [Salinigranum rubrum]|uniref:Uncharacterized protein n=1 Tax=Salinigranum rubrum TaxID=755307 RepID=A0A2I8VHT6_9EURY|nr:hypothetical protein [Salinigranum rubrum]AUV81475.1 hypothetical protein C2R22_07250 [Salinigranum rubrum]
MTDSGSAKRDAALTGVVLVVVAGAAWAVEAPVTPAALVVGAGATVLAELLLSLRAEWVRAVWRRREVQAAAVLVAIAGGVGLALLVGSWVLAALVAALLTYLGFLAASAAWSTAKGGND